MGVNTSSTKEEEKSLAKKGAHFLLIKIRKAFSRRWLAKKKCRLFLYTSYSSGRTGGGGRKGFITVERGGYKQNRGPKRRGCPQEGRHSDFESSVEPPPAITESVVTKKEK